MKNLLPKRPNLTPCDSGNAPQRAKNYTLLILLGIIGLAVVLRFWGLRWGLPNALHSYSYHPDEFLIIGAAFVAVFAGRSLNPGLYNYPSLFIYLSALAMAVAFGYGMKPTEQSIYLIPRVISAIMGVASVGVTYWAGKSLFSRGAGLIAALILCIAPLHVQHSHFGTVDVSSTIFVAAALGFAGLILKSDRWRNYILAGVMIGLAAGTKYNALLVMFSAIAAHFLRESNIWRAMRDGKLWAMLGCIAAAFVISTPGSVLYSDQFLNGIIYEMKHTSTGHGLVFAGTGNGFIYTFASSLWYGLGPMLAVTFLFAVVWSLWKRDKAALVVLAFVFSYYALISLSQVRFARYTLPMFPAIAILCGWLIWKCCSDVSINRSAAKRFLPLVIFGYVLLVTLGYTYRLDAMFAQSDPRDRAARWIFANISKGDSLGLIDAPWFYSPPLSKTFGFGTLPQRREAAFKTPYEISIFADYKNPGSWWSSDKSPNWIIVSDFEIKDAKRLANNNAISVEDKKQVDRILVDLSLINKHYVQRKEFTCSGISGLSGNLPHDMSYACPDISIYEHKND